MMINKSKRWLRHQRVRAKVEGSSVRPRVSVFRSDKHIYTQLIDDGLAKTIVSFSDQQLSSSNIKDKDKKSEAFLVGKSLGQLALKVGIKEVVFDRGGFAYHGRIKAVAEGLREAGIKL